jgi:hypothetical protein
MVEGQFDPEWAHTPSIGYQQISNVGIASQTSRSAYLMYPYLISVYGLGAGEWILFPTLCTVACIELTGRQLPPTPWAAWSSLVLPNSPRVVFRPPGPVNVWMCPYADFLIGPQDLDLSDQL